MEYVIIVVLLVIIWQMCKGAVSLRHKWEAELIEEDRRKNE